MIVNIRGTNGSGKSTVVKTFLARRPYVEVFGVLGPRRPEAYKIRLTGKWLYVIGSYQTNTGGVDAMPLSSTELVALLEKYRKLGHVMFEGVVISTYYGAVGEWLEAHKEEALVVFLDTSEEVCLQSVRARTLNSRTKNIASKIKSIENVRERMIGVGIPTKLLNRGNAFDTIWNALK